MAADSGLIDTHSTAFGITIAFGCFKWERVRESGALPRTGPFPHEIVDVVSCSHVLTGPNAIPTTSNSSKPPRPPSPEFPNPKMRLPWAAAFHFRTPRTPPRAPQVPCPPPPPPP